MEKIRENVWWFSFIAPGLIIVLVARWLTNVNVASGFELTIISFLLNVLLYTGVFALVFFLVGLLNFLSWLTRLEPSYISINASDWRVLSVFALICSVLAIPMGVFLAIAIERDFGRQTARDFADYLFSRNNEFVLPRGSTADPLHSMLRRLNSRRPDEWLLDFRTRHSGVLPVDTSEKNLTCGKLFGTCNVRVRVYTSNRTRGVEGFPVDWHGHGDRAQIFLSPACQIYKNPDWKPGDGKTDATTGEFRVSLVDGPGVWVALSGSSAELEVLDANTSPCATAFENRVCEVSKRKCTLARGRAQGGSQPPDADEKSICDYADKCNETSANP
jgi:hypothetical protein